jgi:hypothetical protein
MALPSGLVFTANASATSAALSATAQTVALPATGAIPQGGTSALVVQNPNSAPVLLQLVAGAPATNLPPPVLNSVGSISVRAGENLLITAPSGSYALIASAGGGAAPVVLTAGYTSPDATRFPDANFPQNIVYVPGSTQ